jgi:hypothetical protein
MSRPPESRGRTNTSPATNRLRVFKAQWHFDSTTFAIINRANFFIVKNGVE